MSTQTAQSFDRINELTGFANGEPFRTEDEVRAYFTTETQPRIFGPEGNHTQEQLDEMAEVVIENRWHWATESAAVILGRFVEAWIAYSNGEDSRPTMHDRMEAIYSSAKDCLKTG